MRKYAISTYNKGLLRHKATPCFAMLPHATDVPFLGQCSVAELHKLNENGADGACRNRANKNSSPLPVLGEGARRAGEGPLTHAKALRKNMTEAEQTLWSHLRAKRFMGIKFKRQKPIGGIIVEKGRLVSLKKVCLTQKKREWG